MAVTINFGSHPDVNIPLLFQEMYSAALAGGEVLYGINTIPETQELLASVEPSAEIEALLQSVLVAHNPNLLTDEQRNRQELLTMDFLQLRTAINTASTLSDLRPILRQMGRLMWQIAKADGLVTSSDPGK